LRYVSAQGYSADERCRENATFTDADTPTMTFAQF